MKTPTFEGGADEQGAGWFKYSMLKFRLLSKSGNSRDCETAIGKLKMS